MLLVLTACAHNPEGFVPAALCGDPAGFLSGLFHGWILFFSFFGSLINSDIAIYAPCNSGFGYDFGFAIGAGAFASSGTAAARHAGQARRAGA